MTLATLVTWLVYTFVLLPGAHLPANRDLYPGHRRPGQLVETVLRRSAPPLYQAGHFLPLITTNCAVLAVACWRCRMNLPGGGGCFRYCAALGFSMALIIMAGSATPGLAKFPRRCRTAVTLITAGILSLAFMGFKGMLTL